MRKRTLYFKLLDLNKKIYIPSKHYVALKLGEMK